MQERDGQCPIQQWETYPIMTGLIWCLAEHLVNQKVIYDKWLSLKLSQADIYSYNKKETAEPPIILQ